jgi:hypothetical protein
MRVAKYMALLTERYYLVLYRHEVGASTVSVSASTTSHYYCHTKPTWQGNPLAAPCGSAGPLGQRALYLANHIPKDGLQHPGALHASAGLRMAVIFFGS